MMPHLNRNKTELTRAEALNVNGSVQTNTLHLNTGSVLKQTAIESTMDVDLQ
jgi:hypothetical protein